MSFVESKQYRANDYFTRLEVDDEDGNEFTDHWNTGELLYLASAVQRSGDKNWVSVSRSIKPFGEPKRPFDWYTPKNCALQYSKLLKGVEDFKKKSLPRTERETSEELLVKNLTDKRLNELNWLNQQTRSIGKVLKVQLENLDNGDFDDCLEDMLKHMEELEKRDDEEYKEWLSKRESLTIAKRLNKCRAPIFKGKAPTSRSLEAKRKNSPNPEQPEQDTAILPLAADAIVKVEIDTDDDLATPSKLKFKSETEQSPVMKASSEENKLPSPQISVPTSHPAPPTSPLLTSLLRNVTSAIPTNSLTAGIIISSPNKEVAAEDPVLPPKLLCVANTFEATNFRKSDSSQQPFLSPTQTPTSSISPLLTSLLKSPTAAAPVSPISTNVAVPSLPKEIEQLEALDPLKIPGNTSEVEGASIPKTKESSPQSSVTNVTHVTPATSPLLNSLLKSPTSAAPASSTISSPLQFPQPKEATTPKTISPSQSFFNPASVLATAAAQQLAVATANLPQDHNLFQQSEVPDGRKSVSFPTTLSTPTNSATLSAPTLSKLLEMPPSTPGKLPPLPVIDSPSSFPTVTPKISDLEQNASIVPGNLQVFRDTDNLNQKSLTSALPKVAEKGNKQPAVEHLTQDDSVTKSKISMNKLPKPDIRKSIEDSIPEQKQLLKSTSSGSDNSPHTHVRFTEAIPASNSHEITVHDNEKNESQPEGSKEDSCKSHSAGEKVVQRIEQVSTHEAAKAMPSIIEYCIAVENIVKSTLEDPLDSFDFDEELKVEAAEKKVTKVVNTGKRQANIDFPIDNDGNKKQAVHLLPSLELGQKVEKASVPVTEIFPVNKIDDSVEDDNGVNSKKFYKSRITSKKRASTEEDVLEKVNESTNLTLTKQSGKKIIRAVKQLYISNSDNDPSTQSSSIASATATNETEDDKDLKVIPKNLEPQSPVQVLKKPRLLEKLQAKDMKKELSEDETSSTKRPGRRPKKCRGKFLKTASSKLDEPKDQYEFSESTEENSVGYQMANTLCYMPRTKDDIHFDESKIKQSPTQDPEDTVKPSHSGTLLTTKSLMSPVDKRYFGTSQKDKQGTPCNTSGKKSISIPNEEHLSDSLDISDDASNPHQISEEKLKNWKEMDEKHGEIPKSIDDGTKTNIRKSIVTEQPKKRAQPIKRSSFNRTVKNEVACKKEKKHHPKAVDSDLEELSACSRDSEETTFQSTSEPAWQRQEDSETNDVAPDKEKSEAHIVEMEAETNDSHLSSSITAESDRQIDDMEGYESLQGSITTEFSTPPPSAKEDKEQSQFGKQEWSQPSSPKSSEPVSQSSEESEDYESDNSDNQSVSTNKSTSHSTEQPRVKRKERESQQYKAWKKSISIVWREASCHKYANVFLQKVTNDVAPGYLSIVNRPMDLSLIKRNIDNSTIRTTSEFQRDMMLMFQNAIMYNSSDHDVYHMAVEMQKDVNKQIQDYLATQLIIEDKIGEPAPSSLRAARNAKAPSKMPPSLPKPREDTDRD